MYWHHVSKYILYVYINIMYDMVKRDGVNSMHISFKYYIVGVYYISCKKILQTFLLFSPHKKKLNLRSAPGIRIPCVLKYFEGSIILYNGRLYSHMWRHIKYIFVIYTRWRSSRVSSCLTTFLALTNAAVCYT